MTRKVSFISTQVAPFQAELAEAVNQLTNVEYKIIFCWRRNQRPAHWLKVEDKIEQHAVTVPGNLNNEAITDWAVQQLIEQQPDVVLAGGVRGAVPDAALRYKHKHSPNTKVGLWMEPPLQAKSRVHEWARAVEYRYRLSRVDFVLAIGDRAETFYRQCNHNTFFVPYGEDLSECFRAELPKAADRPLRFLFSGGLQKRHNFPVIMESFEKLIEARGTDFEFVVSGDGPEQQVIDQWVEKHPLLSQVLIFDRTFHDWNDRLRPFRESDVFVYPTNHAGWGLVIPEAMAAGQLVISTRGAESARYLIDHGKNGLLISPSVNELTKALIRCFDNRQWVSEVGAAARNSAVRGDAPYVARQLMSTLAECAPQRQPSTKRAA